ncbi:MAG: hypothetical protein CMF96_06675 [Candidatus Marinimicrobia bacterium]|nr:hypothetical protein [Candidatus Neomarinimicrobiota bacterium]
MNNKEISIQILGGGPAGISTAYFASENDIKFKLYEAAYELGGNCKTYNIDDFYFDSGAHRFHDKDKRCTDLIKLMLQEDLKLIQVPSQIFINNKFIDFPLSPMSLIQVLGTKSVFIEILKLIKIQFNKKQVTNFRDYAISQYGEKISSMFLLDYSQKLWGSSCENLSVDIAGNRLKGLNFKSLIYELFGLGNKKIKHLDGSFYYPKYGIWSIFERMKEKAGSENFQINNRVTEIFHRQNEITSIKINDRKVIEADIVVSSIPIDKLVKSLNPPPPKEIIEFTRFIKYRNLILIIFLLNKKSVNNNGSMYFPSNEYVFTRIYEPKNRSNYMSPPDKTSLVVEIPVDSNETYKDDEISKLISKIKNQLIKIGFFNNQEIIKVESKYIRNAYPILDTNYKKNLIPIKEYLSQFKNLILNGRNGKYEYNHIHDHIRDGRYISSLVMKNCNF